MSDETPDKLLLLGLVGLGLAHELTSPLTATTLSTELLLHRIDTATADIGDVRHELEKIHTRLLRMGTLIQRFRALARQSSGRHAAVDLDAVVDETIELTRHALAELSPARLERGARADVGAVEADHVLLVQAVSCIVLNAADALQEHGGGAGRIWIQASAGPSIVVRDDGPGFPDLQQALTPGVSSKGGRGMGVGLAMAELIVKDAGGTLTVQNHADGGAIVSIHF